MHATPSTYKYPELMKKEEEKVVGKLETAVLSTTAKVKARIDRKNKAEGNDVEMSVVDEAIEEKKEADKPDVVAPEPKEYIMNNPARVFKG